jgi:Zn-dependent metalloprotease
MKNFGISTLSGAFLILVATLNSISQLTGPSDSAGYGKKLGSNIDVHRITVENYGYKVSELNETKVEQLARKLIDDFSKSMGITSDHCRKITVYKFTDWWTARFEQTVNGVPVDGSEVALTIGGQGQVVGLGGIVYSGIGNSTSPSIPESSAVRIASVAAGLGAKAEPTAKSDTISLSPDIREGRLIIRPREMKAGFQYDLVWEITIDHSSRPVISRKYFIDARTGDNLGFVSLGRNVLDGH